MTTCILVIDDEAAVGRALLRVIGDHETKLITSGREALDHLRGGASYDVIFCDLSMPDLGGLDLHQTLGKTRPELLSRFVFVTGGALQQSAKAFFETAQNQVLPKPYDLKQVRTALRSQLELQERLRKA